MTIVDRVDSSSTSAPADAHLPPPRSPVRLRFVGHRGDYWRLMIRGGVLQAVTLGIYRFWLFTDMRRFLWASTEVDGETLEYTGTPIELLIGFLIAVGILAPVYALLFAASLELGILSPLSGIAAFVVLAAFGQYAAFRARRYRLTRTVFRGLRFHQSGSAVRYALRAMLWWLAIALTLGLASPWATANLERYKMRNTFYGSLGGSFAGSAGRLFWRGVLIWLAVIGPLAAGLVAAAALIDWPAVMQALGRGNVASFDAAMKGNERTMVGIGALAAAATWSMLFAVILYPAYQAIVMRWWLGGVRIGGAVAASDLQMRRYYFAYLRYLLYVALFSIAFAVVALLVLRLAHASSNFTSASILRDGVAGPDVILAAVAGIVAYVIYILGVSTIYQVVVKMRLWQAAVESVMISGIVALDHVQAGEATASAVGEGLADALGAGAI
ncbi:MAG TPA: DUF898 family protein [Xanthobacteraceae bacterium]|jgi:uncharacterized membrane protein YjgN (DUF898 family)|nr:DUF898 family protein [Xanthobacteraceae bacterium]